MHSPEFKGDRAQQFSACFDVSLSYSSETAIPTERTTPLHQRQLLRSDSHPFSPKANVPCHLLNDACAQAADGLHFLLWQWGIKLDGSFLQHGQGYSNQHLWETTQSENTQQKDPTHSYARSSCPGQSHHCNHVVILTRKRVAMAIVQVVTVQGCLC